MATAQETCIVNTIELCCHSKLIQEMYKNLREILSGEKSIRLYLEFLQKNNHADLRILKNTKVSIILSQPLSSHVVIDA